MTGELAYIDDEPFEIRPGETLLSFLRRHGREVPTLCDAPNLKPFGSCRLCSVEVGLKAGGPRKVMASCHAPVSPGQWIYPDSERIRRLRRNIVELVLTDYPADRLYANPSGRNELRNAADALGISPEDVRYPPGKNHRDRERDDSHPYMRADPAACIHCYRCVRACDEVQGEMALSMAGRGFDHRVIMGLDGSFADSACVACGACAQACPTEAITDVFRSKGTVAEKTVRTVCTYCGVGCNLEVAVAGGEIKSILAPYDAEVNRGHTCLKGRYAFEFQRHPDRLKTPLIRKEGGLVPASWDEAYGIIAERLAAIKHRHGPDAIAGISCARATNEENYLMQKFIRAVIGTNNIDGCARVCHSPTALGMQRAFGTGAATNSIRDLEYTDCILVIGANPIAAHPVTGAKIKQKAMKGTPLIVIDPRRTELARYATHHLQIRPGTNVAVLDMMMHFIVAEGREDREFIDRRTEGFAACKEELLRLDLGEMEKIAGVDRKQVRAAALAYASAEAAMSFHGLGVTEHSQGTDAVESIADLALITGNLGRRGTGVNPLRGQNNVQGLADMGCQPHQGAGYLAVDDEANRLRYEGLYGAKLPPAPGLKIPEMFAAASRGDLKALWIIGEDVAQTDPDTRHVLAALKSLDLLVVNELFPNRTTALAHVVLPAASFFEKSGTFTNGERRIQRVRQAVDPPGLAKSDGQIIVDMMNRMGYRQPDYDPGILLQEISRVVPFFQGVTWEGLGDNGKQWPVGIDGRGTEILHVEAFTRGKGRIRFHAFRESPEIDAHARTYPFILTTNRDLEHYNCGAMTRRTRNVDILGEDLLLIHPADAESKGIRDGDWVCVSSVRGKVDLRARYSEQVKPGILSSTFHFPDRLVNMLTSGVVDPDSQCPEYKVVAVDIRKARGGKRQSPA